MGKWIDLVKAPPHSTDKTDENKNRQFCQFNPKLQLQELDAMIADEFLRGDYSSVPSNYRPTLQEMADFLGNEWDRIADDLIEFKYWYELLITNRLIAAGIRPPWFKCRAFCEKCRDIWLDYSITEPLVGCPWCFSPKTEKV